MENEKKYLKSPTLQDKIKLTGAGLIVLGYTVGCLIDPPTTSYSLVDAQFGYTHKSGFFIKFPQHRLSTGEYVRFVVKTPLLFFKNFKPDLLPGFIGIEPQPRQDVV